MFCLGCGRLGGDLCDLCRAHLTPAPDRLLDDGLLVRSAFRHEGPARDLVHHYKYRGSDRAGWMLARALAPLIPEETTIVPVPRSSWRHLRYGIDPAPDLARRIGILTGCVVVFALAAPALAHRQAGRKRSDRQPAVLRVSSRPRSAAVVLVDDVLTTGRTLSSARAVLRSSGIRVDSAITATARGD
ncbi:MAG: ComF family protein [Acidimicrobiia bacterium]